MPDEKGLRSGMKRKAREFAKTRRRHLLEGVASTWYKAHMEIKLAAIFRKFPEGYAAFVEKSPGANTQGPTLDEARANLKEAVGMVLQANRYLAEESLCGAGSARRRID